MARLIIALLFLVLMVTAALFVLIVFLSSALLFYGRKPKTEKAPAEG